MNGRYIVNCNSIVQSRRRQSSDAVGCSRVAHCLPDDSQAEREITLEMTWYKVGKCFPMPTHALHFHHDYAIYAAQ